MIWGSGGSKSRLPKAAGAEPAGQMRDEKLHAVVARSTFASQNVQNTPGADHFWQLRCRKSARRCGAKHICKSKCAKRTRCGPLLAVEMSKKCTPLWREAHLEVKMYKAHHVRTHLASWLRTRRFSEPTFRPSLEKHSVSRLSYLFAHLHLLSSDSFSSLILSLLLSSSLCLCPALLFICPYCRKFDV